MTLPAHNVCRSSPSDSSVILHLELKCSQSPYCSSVPGNQDPNVRLHQGSNTLPLPVVRKRNQLAQPPLLLPSEAGGVTVYSESYDGYIFTSEVRARTG